MFRQELMWRLSLALTLFLSITDIHGETVVDLSPIKIHGTTMTTRKGRNISAFLGIRYALPPIDYLRFRPPEPWFLDDIVELLDEDIMANVDGNQCPQLNDVGVVVGDEDCLFLNVYTPEVRPEEPFPTMVYFHGGDFVRGSGSSIDAGPEYLLDKDVVLVTVNYRLGVLGFLSTGDAEAPGNWGLKDQALALQWVRYCIHYFGGAKTPVTIFGQGAGGASTSLHAMSDLSQDLFDRYISQSGSATVIWGYADDQHDYAQRATDLGKYLNCPTDDSTVLVDCLRDADARSLVDSNDIFDDTRWHASTWAATKEPKIDDGAFLTSHPFDNILGHNMKDCPAIFGNVHDEGLLFTADFYANHTAYEIFASNFRAFISDVVEMFYYTENSIDFDPVDTLLDFYFNDTSPTDGEAFIRNLTNFMTDALFGYAQYVQMKLMFYYSESPLYSYSFNYRGTFSRTSTTIGNNDNVGVTHGDELIYLFPVKNIDFEPSESDENMIDIMVDFWTSFATTGVPTSQYTSNPNVWTPYENETELVLGIGNNSDPMVQLEHMYDERLIIWTWVTSRLLVWSARYRR